MFIDCCGCHEAAQPLPKNTIEHGGDVFDFGVDHSWKERQGHGAGKVSVCDWKLARLGWITFLPIGHSVKWPVMNRRTNACSGERVDHVIARYARWFTNTYWKQMPAVKAAYGGEIWKVKWKPCESFQIL